MDRLDQLFARSKREIEAHTDELGDTETARYVIDEAAQLLTALRLCAQSQYRTRSPGAPHPRARRRRAGAHSQAGLPQFVGRFGCDR